MTREEFITLAITHEKALRRFLDGVRAAATPRLPATSRKALLKAYISIDTLADFNKFKPWLYRIAVNIFINQYRKRLYTVRLFRGDNNCFVRHSRRSIQI